MKNTKAIGLYFTLLAGIVAVVDAVLYRNVMYRFQPVYYILIAAIVLACLAFMLAGSLPVIANLVPIVNAALMASAFVWGTSLMVNQIGYVYAGLDGMDTIQSFIIFGVLALVGMLLNIIASFLPAVKTAE